MVFRDHPKIFSNQTALQTFVHQKKQRATFVLAPIRLDNAHGLHRLDGQVTDQSAKPFPLQGWSNEHPSFFRFLGVRSQQNDGGKKPKQEHDKFHV